MFSSSGVPSPPPGSSCWGNTKNSFGVCLRVCGPGCAQNPRTCNSTLSHCWTCQERFHLTWQPLFSSNFNSFPNSVTSDAVFKFPWTLSDCTDFEIYRLWMSFSCFIKQECSSSNSSQCIASLTACTPQALILLPLITPQKGSTLWLFHLRLYYKRTERKKKGEAWLCPSLLAPSNTIIRERRGKHGLLGAAAATVTFSTSPPSSP